MIEVQSYSGDAAQVCTVQGDEFICPTDGVPCDLGKCPLQGTPTAPLTEPQATGWFFTGDFFPRGVVFISSSQFTVPKRKTIYSQPELLLKKFSI